MPDNQYNPDNFIKYHEEQKQRSESKWNALSKEDQLDYFCAIARRICKAELEKGCSYRTALYDVFGFGPEAYAQAQMSGYLDLHNALYNSNRLEATVEEFCLYGLGISKEEFSNAWEVFNQ